MRKVADGCERQPCRFVKFVADGLGSPGCPEEGLATLLAVE